MMKRESLKNTMTKRIIKKMFLNKLKKKNQVSSRMKMGKTHTMMKMTID